MSTTWQTPISSFETNRRRVGALKSLGVVSVGDALTYYPFRVTDPVPARALREAKIGENMAFAAHVRGVRVFPMARRGFRLIADVDDGDFARSRHMDASMASLVFFSYRKSYVDWIQRKLHEGALLVVAGEPSVYNDRLQFTHPDILTVDPAGEQLRSRSSEEAAEWDDGFGTEQPAVVPQSPTMPNLKYDAASVPEAMRHVCRPRPVYHANSRISSEHIHESIEKCMDRLCGDEYAAAQAARALHGADASDAQHGEFDAPQADRQARTEALAAAIPDIMPEAFRMEHGLMHRAEAFRAIHDPQNRDGFNKALRTLRYEEALICQTALVQSRDSSRKATATACADTRLKDDFVESLPFSLTDGQQQVIADISDDMARDYPMQRLLQGEVGSGKTVVAALAAMLAVERGKQVALAAPTELLAEQHLLNLRNWLEPLGVRVAWLAGKVTGKARGKVLEEVASGHVQVVVGTHALMQDNVVFNDLALAIVDEQHRFGVHQRLALRDKGATTGVMPHQLVMTATPIPRTLSMALEGLRDFSLITTAPSRRLAVKTFVKPFSEGSVREAVLRELKRGGQVFFLHNEVETIENMRERLETLLPEARIGVAHGQLRERELEQVMRDFLQQHFNVLLCSTIIETGIDIPNANTIIINRADKFGLAQLHQLRGRVGRSHHQAYAYLLTPEYITKDAEKRLDAIAAADELGAGFTLAMQDLEIRGAGEILGEGQSGEMMQVGFTLYTEMLKQAVRDLKKGRQPDLDAPLGVTTEIKLHSPALLPESYCPDIHERLVLYKRLATCETEAQINAVHEELVDRFGLPEQPVKTLIESHRIRLNAKAMGIDAIDATSEAVTLTFGKHHNLDPADIIMLMQSNKNWRMAGADKLRVGAVSDDVETRIHTVKAVLKKLAGK